MYAALHTILIKSRGIGLAQLIAVSQNRASSALKAYGGVYRKREIFMLIKEITDIGVAECTEDTSLTDVYDLIQASSKGYVVVIDSLKHRVPIGIIDEHSICENLVKRSKSARGLAAGNVMNANIRRVSENTEVGECSGLSQTNDALLVVNAGRQFIGTVDPDRFERAIARASLERPSFATIISRAVPAAVEIPAFGWLK